MSAELREEAAMVAAFRSTAQRTDYLFEVAHNPSRGPEVAAELQRLVGEILAGSRVIQHSSMG